MDIGAWVLDHQVCFELRPRYEKAERGVVRAGLRLELFARGPTFAADPGSAECHAVYDALVELARLALPADLTPIAFAPFDHAFRLAPGPGSQPEIELALDIGPLPRAPGSAERLLLRRLEERLRGLGIRPRGEPPVERRSARTASIPPGTGCPPERRGPVPAARPALERRAVPEPIRRVA
ncbi:MAG TPA: hypothetical protein VFM88_09755 [Vicinamibacteria bacterium]|nr:hypothetical protein [Vicinamibacteria bacterium]